MAYNLKRKRGKEVTFQDKRRHTAPDEESAPDGTGDEDAEADQTGSPGDKENGAEDEDTDDDQGEEWSGVGSGEQVDSAQVPENQQTGGKPKKPPTGEELKSIKDATDLYRSSSFKLQIDALLPNVRPKESRTPPLERVLLPLYTLLLSIPSVPPQQPLMAARGLVKKGIAVPYPLPLPSEDTNWKVGFEKPNDVTLVGSWANKMSVKPKDKCKFGVDLAVEMPASLFQEKDYMNGRFFHKRAFYLAIIASAVTNRNSGLNLEVAYESASNDPRLTTLVLRSQNDESANDFTKLNAQIRIIPSLPTPSPIAIHRLSPAHSNVRIPSQSKDTDSENQLATPLYNTAILLSQTPKSHLLATHTLKQSTPAFGDALTLLRLWANQRGYGGGTKMCVRGFEGKGSWWTAVLGFLITGGEPRAGNSEKEKRRPLGKGLSSYQLFRAALNLLAHRDFETEPIYLKTENGHRFAPEEYSKHHGAIFIDSSSTVNLLAGVPLSSLDLLRYDAKQTLQTLDSPLNLADPFTEVFLKEKRDLPTRFDTLIRVNISSAKLRNPSLNTTFDYGSLVNSLLAALASLLRRALGNRTKAIGILHQISDLRPIMEAHPSTPSIIYIGLIHDPVHASRLVDHGPAADDPDQTVADRFRGLWGEKAELRRFKDGRIVESVVWDVSTSDERAHIPAMIVRHILGRHLHLGSDAMQTWQAPFDGVLKLPDPLVKIYQGLAVSAGFKGAMSAYENFVKSFKALDEELPLSILTISPVSEYLRYTSAFSPVPHLLSSSLSLPEPMQYFPIMEIILEFEKSGRWPDDLHAIQKIKLAFFERIASVLMSSIKGMKATVVVCDKPGTSEIQDQARLEIITPQGWAFSARIWHDREATLLERIVNEKFTVPHLQNKHTDERKAKERQEALEARDLYMRRFIHAPRHHRVVASLCHRFSAYAGTVRLVKRWLASHWLLDGHISGEAVEIICSSLFIESGKASGDDRPGVPGSKERGFAAVVEFLKGWNWEDGLFVPLYDIDSSGFSEKPIAVAAPASTQGVWTITTEVDKGGHMWTNHGPDIVVARRVRVLAKATSDCLQSVEDGSLDVKALFIHPTEDYDFVVQLNPSILPRYHQNINANPTVWSREGKYANLPTQEDEASRTPRPGFDPTQLLFEDLKRTYADTFKVFCDPFGGDRLGAVWDPSLKSPRPFRVLGGFSSLVKQGSEKKDKAQVVLNENSVLSEIERIGLGLIKGITIHA